MRAALPLTIAAFLVSPCLMAQDTDTTEADDNLREGVVEGDEADEAVEELLDEIRAESRAREEDTQAESTEEPRVAAIPPASACLDAIVAAIAEGGNVAACEEPAKQQ